MAQVFGQLFVKSDGTLDWKIVGMFFAVLAAVYFIIKYNYNNSRTWIFTKAGCMKKDKVDKNCKIVKFFNVFGLYSESAENDTSNAQDSLHEAEKKKLRTLSEEVYQLMKYAEEYYLQYKKSNAKEYGGMEVKCTHVKKQIIGGSSGGSVYGGSGGGEENEEAELLCKQIWTRVKKKGKNENVEKAAMLLWMANH